MKKIIFLFFISTFFSCNTTKINDNYFIKWKKEKVMTSYGIKKKLVPYTQKKKTSKKQIRIYTKEFVRNLFDSTDKK